MSVLLSVRNEVAPGSRLCANVEKLRDDGKQKMRKAEEFMQVSVVAGFIFVLAVNGGEFRAPNENRPDESNRAYEEIGFHDTQRFRTKVRFVSVACLAHGDLLRRQFDPRKNEDGTDQCSADCAEGIEGLCEVQAAFRTIRVPQLSNEGIGSGLQERQAAGNDEQREEKEAVAPCKRSGPKQESTGSIKNQTGDKPGLYPARRMRNAAGIASKKYPM